MTFGGPVPVGEKHIDKISSSNPYSASYDGWTVCSLKRRRAQSEYQHDAAVLGYRPIGRRTSVALRDHACILNER